jgi:hypothetical protein
MAEWKKQMKRREPNKRSFEHPVGCDMLVIIALMSNRRLRSQVSLRLGAFQNPLVVVHNVIMHAKKAVLCPFINFPTRIC